MKKIILLIILSINITLPLLASDWALPLYTGRKSVVLNHTSGSKALVDFPICVKFSPDNFDYSAVRTDGGDFFPVDSDNTPLDWHIDEWNYKGESVLWIRVPLIDKESSRTVTIYYGNRYRNNVQNTNAVYSSNYKLVMHLGKQNVGTNTGFTPDVSGYNNHGDLRGRFLLKDQYHDGELADADDLVTGIVGKGFDLNGGVELINLGNGLSNRCSYVSWAGNGTPLIVSNHPGHLFTAKEFTLSMWFKTPNDKQNYLFAKGPNVHVAFRDYAAMFQWRTSTLGPKEVRNTITPGKWNHVVVASYFSATSRKYVHNFYLNGVQIDKGETSDPYGSTFAKEPLTFGSILRYDSTPRFTGELYSAKGVMDEIMMKSTVAHSTWVKAHYQMIAEENTFLTLGSSETYTILKGMSTAFENEEIVLDLEFDVPVSNSFQIGVGAGSTLSIQSGAVITPPYGKKMRAIFDISALESGIYNLLVTNIVNSEGNRFEPIVKNRSLFIDKDGIVVDPVHWFPKAVSFQSDKENYPILVIDIEKEENLYIQIFTENGKSVATLANEKFPAGRVAIPWNLQESDNMPAQSGFYLAKVTIGEKSYFKTLYLRRETSAGRGDK